MREIWHQYILRVGYKETDQMAVVHHANYVTWFETGRTEWMRAFGLAYSDVESKGLLLPVLEVNVKYRSSAHYDEVIGVFTKIKAFSPVRLEFCYEVRRLAKAGSVMPAVLSQQVSEPVGELLATGSSVHMWVNAEWRPTKISIAAPEVYKLIENIVE